MIPGIVYRGGWIISAKEKCSLTFIILFSVG